MLCKVLFILLITFEVRRCYLYKRYKRFFEKVKRHPNWPLLDQGTFCGTEFPEEEKFQEDPWDVTSRTLGGVSTKPREYPWMALLIVEFNDGNISYICGGSLINSRYVLTAAHCCKPTKEIERMEGQLRTVRLGEYDFGKDQTCSGGYCTFPKDVEIEEIIPHEDYDPVAVHNDICLLRLQEVIEFSESKYPICLPVFEELDQEWIGTTMTVTGWGFSNKEGYVRTDGILNEVDLDVKPRLFCQRKWYYQKLVNTQMCAGGDKGRDACAGDSGGPLIYRAPVRGPLRYFAMGIVSYGRQCSNIDYWFNKMDLWKPGIYTKVLNFIPWILENIRP